MTTRCFEQIGATVYGTATAKVRQPVSKKLNLVSRVRQHFRDDDPDITLTFKGGIENNNGNNGNNKRIEVYTYHNSICINIDESNISLAIMEKRSREFGI